MEKVHKFCICGEPFGYTEPAAALAPTKNKQVGCEGDFCGYLPVVLGKSTEKQLKKLKNSIRKSATGQSQQQDFLSAQPGSICGNWHYRELYIWKMGIFAEPACYSKRSMLESKLINTPISKKAREFGDIPNYEIRERHHQWRSVKWN